MPSEPLVYKMLADDRGWLEKQPEMAPWNAGCKQLVGLLDERFESYSTEVRTEVTEEEKEDEKEEERKKREVREEAERQTYRARLWLCLRHHWQHAIEASDNGKATSVHVAEQIEGGKGYRRGGQLGGNPLRDVVLAVAMVQKDKRARLVFTEDYRGFAIGMAFKVNERLVEAPDDWWFDLLDHLAGYSNSKAHLDNFSGKCALQNWLGRVVWNFLHRHDLHGGNPPDIPEPPDTSPPEPDDESLALFAEVVRPVIAKLSKKDRLLLALVYVDGLKRKDAAEIFGVHAGQITRRLQRIFARLKFRVIRRARNSLGEDAVIGILEDVCRNPQAFGEVISEAIEQGREEES